MFPGGNDGGRVMKRMKFRVSAVAFVVAATTLAAGGLSAPAQAAAKPALPREITEWLDSDMTPSQWGWRAVNAPAAQSAGFDGTGVTVAIIDTGVDASHPELRGQLLSGVKYVANASGNGFTTLPVKASEHVDEYAHGTHVAGIIGGRDDGKGITGVAPGVKILPISVFDSGTEPLDELTFIAMIADAVTSAAERGARVINMSLGGDTLEPSANKKSPEFAEVEAAYRKLCTAITDAREKHGAISVVAAGNSGSEGSSSSPADCPAAVSVASLDSTLRPSGFSSYDESVDVAAPGSAVLSSVPDGYAVFEGTSMAAPHVAGVVALLLQQNPKASADAIVNALEGSALDVGKHGVDVRTGHGLVDAAAALGVAAPKAQAEESFWVLAREANSPFPEATVFWGAPDSEDVVGYTLYDLNTATGATTVTPFGPNAVRSKTPIPLDGKHWVRVVANLSNGDVLEGGWSLLPNLEAPPAIQGMKARVVAHNAKRTIVKVTWKVPDTPGQYSNTKITYEGGTQSDSSPAPQRVSLAKGTATITLPSRLRDSDLVFTLSTQLGDRAVSGDALLAGRTFASLTETSGLGMKGTVTYAVNPSAAAKIGVKHNKHFVLEVRKAGSRKPAARYTGKMDTKSDLAMGFSSAAAIMKKAVRLPRAAGSSPEFRVGVKVKGKRLWTPWRGVE